MGTRPTAGAETGRAQERRTPSLRIRHVTAEDVDAVLRCLAAAFAPYRARYTPPAYEDTVLTPETVRERLREMTVLLAEDETGAVVGTLALTKTPAGDGHLRGMAVVPAALGTGVAARLLAAAEEELRARGHTRVTLDTTRPLERAIRFYERHGYRATGAVTDFFGMDLVEYAKDL